MGEVYRARDPRLRRDVAVKVIHSSLATPDYVRRLTREARSAGGLNHPNILAVFDVGTEGEVPYIVSELLEGESLRQRMERGPLPHRKALEIGAEVASALAAAHDKGICHRDVKPANVFLTADGRVKLLDFGLARIEKPAEPVSPDDSTASASRPGVARGTAGYMAPEQVRGDPIDHRADVFALGVLLYEMLTGQRAFQRDTPVETMSAVLRDDPADVLDVNPSVPPAAAAAVRRCLEKNRDERFQSARDLAFHLHHLEELGSQGARRERPGPSRRAAAVVAAALVVAALAAAWLLSSRAGGRPATGFHQLTFGRGRIGGARFTPAGIAYSKAVGTGPPEVHLLLAGSLESRPLGISEADVLAERGGELALAVGRRFIGGARFVGTLALVSASGGTPREILGEVEEGDWHAGSGDFAVARTRGYGAPSWLEYPIGKTVYESSGALHGIRISPDGSRVAFFEDATGIGSGGRLMVVGREGAARALTGELVRARGTAWRGTEIWFTGSEGREKRSLRAVDGDGRSRVLLDAPGSLRLWDLAADGRVLLAREDERMSLFGMAPGADREREYSAFDDAGLAALTGDGALLLFGDRHGLYVRRTDGSDPIRLGLKDVFADDLSPDGKLVLATSNAKDRLNVIPVGPGDPRPLPAHGASYVGARFFPDGRRVLFNSWDRSAAERSAHAPGHLRSYVTDVDGAAPAPVTPPGVHALAISPDGARLAVRGAGPGIAILPLGGTQAALIDGSRPEDRPVGWTEDGRALWVFQRGKVPADIVRLEIDTGRRTVWKTLVPPDPAGVFSINDVRVTPRGHAYFYSYRRVLSELYLASGLR